jgi:hypothetical protein
MLKVLPIGIGQRNRLPDQFTVLVIAGAVVTLFMVML